MASVSIPANGSAVELSVVPRVVPGERVTVSYDKARAGTGTNGPLAGTYGHEAPSFTDRVVLNPPALTGAAVNGSVLTLSFEGRLDAGSVPAAGDFAVTEGGEAFTVNSDGVAVEGSELRLTLWRDAGQGTAVRVSYTQGATPLRGANGSAVANIVSRSVENVTVATPPTVVEARVVPQIGTSRVSLVFSERLKRELVFPPNKFTVTVDGIGHKPVDAAAAGFQTLLRVPVVVRAGQTVTVSYRKHPPGARLQDFAGDEVASFGPVAARYLGPPVVTRAAVKGTALSLVFSVALNEDLVPLPAAFAVSVDGAARAVAAGGVAISGETVTLTLASAVTHGQAVTVAYDRSRAGAEWLAAPAGGGGNVRNFAARAVTNEVPPAFVSAAVDGTALSVVFEGALKADSVPAPGAFAVTVNGAARAVKAGGVAVAGREVTLTLSAAVEHGEAVTVAYAPGSDMNLLKDRIGNEVEGFGARAAANETPHENAPKVTDAGVRVTSSAGADATYLLGDTVRVQVSFDKAVHVTGAPRLKLGLAAGASGERWAAYESGTGTATLTFAYRVVAGDVSSAGVSVRENTLELNGGSIRAVSTVPANLRAGLRHGGLGHDPAHRVDSSLTAVPAPQAAGVDGTTLAMVFSAFLDGASRPAASAFTVTVAGTARTPSAVSIAGRSLTLTLATAVAEDQVVTVGYEKPAAGHRLRALDGAGEAAAFGGFAVRNATNKVWLQRAQVNGAVLTLAFSGALDETKVPSRDDFTVRERGRSRWLFSDGVRGGGQRGAADPALGGRRGRGGHGELQPGRDAARRRGRRVGVELRRARRVERDGGDAAAGDGRDRDRALCPDPF